MKNCFKVLSVLVVLSVLLPCMASAQPFPTGPADDVTQSMGMAIVWVHPAFRPLVSGLPGWNSPLPNHWTSPVLLDPNTVIGRSNPHNDGGVIDASGTPVGTAGTIVADTSFSVVPTFNFTEGPVGSKEVHTELYKMRLRDRCGMFEVRAGTGAGVAFPSYGEVEAKPGSSDFPAESFFNVYIEMDTPFFGGTILYNMVPLLVVDPSLMSLPPTVVYIHEETPAVPIYFKNGPHTGQLFGYLRLAGHKTNTNAQMGCPIVGPDANDLRLELQDTELMNCPQCQDNADVNPVEPVGTPN